MYNPEEWEMPEHYVWYDGPLTYLMKHKPTGKHYIGNAVDWDKEKGIYVESLVLMTEETYHQLIENKITVREVMIKGIGTEGFFLIQRTKEEPRYLLKPCSKEELFQEVLIDEEIANFYINGKDGEDEK